MTLKMKNLEKKVHWWNPRKGSGSRKRRHDRRCQRSIFAALGTLSEVTPVHDSGTKPKKKFHEGQKFQPKHSAKDAWNLFENSPHGYVPRRMSKRLFGGDFSVLRQKWRRTNELSKGKWLDLRDFVSQINDNEKKKEDREARRKAEEARKLSEAADKMAKKQLDSHLKSPERFAPWNRDGPSGSVALTPKEGGAVWTDVLGKEYHVSEQSLLQGNVSGLWGSGLWRQQDRLLDEVQRLSRERQGSEVARAAPPRVEVKNNIIEEVGETSSSARTDESICVCVRDLRLNTGVYIKVKVRNGFLVRCKTCRKLYRVSADGNGRGSLFSE